MTRKFSFGNLKVKCELCGFKVSPRFAMTGHKTQGMTMEDLFIAGWGTYKTGKGEWLYVVLSRVKDLKNIYILEELNTDITKYVARTYEVNEDRRLELLAKGTARRFGF